jgi:hypothetical protein
MHLSSLNSFTSNQLNQLSACRKQIEHVLNIIGSDFRGMREKQLKCIGKIGVHSFVDKVFHVQVIIL